MLMTLAELGAISVAAILGAILLMSLLHSNRAQSTNKNTQTHSDANGGAVFLFHGEALVDATADAWSLISHRAKNLPDFDATLAILTPEFPNLNDILGDPEAFEIRIQNECDPNVFVDVKRTGDRLRFAITTNESQTYRAVMQRLTLAGRDTQTTLMDSITANSPQLIWHEDSTGALLWANDAYAKILRENNIPSLVNPPLGQTTEEPRRIPVKLTTDRWFDITTVAHADGLLHFANDATEIVRAETAKTEFVTTLGKTFAELSIGLAIFDKNRQLAMFNPALTDMTNLPFDFLSARPAVDTLLDRLREQRMMPEPKDYVSWREQFTAVETDAKNGTYGKNWTLPDGQIYRVAGRPYPDGAFALLFEDISAEVSLTRRFRLDIETGQAVLDTLTDSIAVFSSTGTLVMSNKAYADLWSSEPERMLEHRILSSEMKTWQDRCIPSPMWNDMRNFIQQMGARKPWADNALLDDGRHLYCHANPIAGGMTMVRFAIDQPKRPEIRKLMQPDLAIQAAKR